MAVSWRDEMASSHAAYIYGCVLDREGGVIWRAHAQGNARNYFPPLTAEDANWREVASDFSDDTASPGTNGQCERPYPIILASTANLVSFQKRRESPAKRPVFIADFGVRMENRSVTDREHNFYFFTFYKRGAV
jgi:hypothetical protein